MKRSPLNMLGIKQDSSQLKNLERKRDSVNQRIPKHLGGKHPSQKINGEFNTVDDDMDFKSRTSEQIAVLKPKKSPLNNYQNPKREYFSNREDFANLFKTVGDAASAAVTKKGDEKAMDKARKDYMDKTTFGSGKYDTLYATSAQGKADALKIGIKP
jgi:hypothetical protein|tara:strand:+ start:88 stop:558 length:471 start_codon:yes stop_codon:yes gene_type:complete